MLRIFFEILLPLVLPTAVYLIGVRIACLSRRGGTMGWANLPWLWLAGAGALLLALILFVVTVGFGTSQPGVYVPPRLENGRIAPGHMEPEHSP